MSRLIVVTVLVENTVYGRELKAEHGLAFHLKAGAASLLFDTGQSDLVTSNARVLGVDLAAVRAVALSHGHYDHTGGLPAVRRLAPDTLLYAHPAALRPRFVRDPDHTTRPVGIPPASLAAAQLQRHSTRQNSGPIEVLPGIFLTGEIPRETDFEDVGGPFVLDEAGTQPDPIADDQALFFDTQEGVVVLVGCAHAGVVNTLRYIRRLTHDRPIHALLGGLHLLAADPNRLDRTMAAFRDLQVQRLGPAHCTGAAATARLWTEFPQACMVCAVGSRFVFRG